jgi:hypothetical protein
LLFYSFIFSKICKNKFYNFNNIIKEFWLLLDWYILILNNFYKFLIINIKLFFSKINLNMYVYDEIFIFDDFKSNNIIIIIFYKYIYKYIYSLLPEFIKFIEKQNKIRIESFWVEYNKKYNIVGKSFWHIDVLRYKLLKLINGGLVMTYVDDNIK